MADNFLEYHREAYEKRKSQWLKKQKRRSVLATMQKAKALNKNEILCNENEGETLCYENEGKMLRYKDENNENNKQIT